MFVYMRICVEVTDNYSKQPPTNATATPVVRDLLFQGLTFSDCHPSALFDGLPESVISNVTLIDVDFGGDVKFSKCDYVSGVCDGDVSPCPPCFKQ